MLHVEWALARPRLCRALTGLTPEEFTNLLPAFAEAWEQAALDRYRQNRQRERKPGAGQKGIAPTVQDKLFLALLYAKCYPTFDLLGFLYQCDRSAPCKRVQALFPILEAALGRKLVLPKRQIRTPEEFFRLFPEAREVFVDGTERPVQRPKDPARQRAVYSGKKKRHTRKNLVLTDGRKRVLVLSPTVEGKRHDFPLLKDAGWPEAIPKTVPIHADSGFQGFVAAYPGHAVSMPRKKPKGGTLSPQQKGWNTRRRRVRVLVEHALAGVKRFRIVSDTFRNKREEFADRAMLLTSGLWNWHLATTATG